ncbi:barstar family protein [Streptomyces ficellus]|uniref:Barnase inhibitor n=1 Tax=Streptomyces ficellus TaxID=1977088 RepID=A0A6I6FFF2_9ACTN|nr:barstar family protein [Streptomyces ficellus]QGV77289.1 barnase inhibitor [Streptomyces ficellus]
MEVVIEGAVIRSAPDFHRFLAQALDFGPYYGANLSALWDRLTTDVERPVEIVWKDAHLSRAAFGENVFDQIRDLLLRVQEQDRANDESKRFSVTFD